MDGAVTNAIFLQIRLTDFARIGHIYVCVVVGFIEHYPLADNYGGRGRVCTHICCLHWRRKRQSTPMGNTSECAWKCMKCAGIIA